MHNSSCISYANPQHNIIPPSSNRISNSIQSLQIFKKLQILWIIKMAILRYNNSYMCISNILFNFTMGILNSMS